MLSLSAPHQQHREVGRTRPWARFVPRVLVERVEPKVRHRLREVGEPGPGEDVIPVGQDAATAAVVTRLWLGVLSMFTLIVGVGLVGMVLGAWALGYRPVVVTSGSMEPAIRRGDIVITKEPDAGEALGAQTVIDFESPDGSGRRLHRIVEVTPTGYRTKGDDNPTPDSVIVPPEAVQGTGLVLAPFAGFVPLWIDQGLWLNVAVSLIALVAVATMSRRSWMWSRTEGTRWKVDPA